MTTHPRAQTVHGLLTRAAARMPGLPAVIAPDGSATTFAELDEHSRSIASWLARETDPGDRIAIVGDNSLPYTQSYYGVPRAGRVLVLINQRLDVSEQLAAISMSRPRVLLGDSRYLDALAGDLAERVPALETVIPFESARWHSITAGGSDIADDTRPDDPAWLVFTSGSTGRPKAVAHTHRSLTAAVWGTVEGRHITGDGVYLFPFPMCHIAGYNVLVHHAMASTVVLTAHFRPGEFIDLVRRHEVTACSLAPTMLHALLTHLDRTGATLPTLREVGYGSAAISADLIDRATTRLGIDLNQGYGMTETGGNVTFLGPADHRAGAAGDAGILRSVGMPHSSVEVGVIDAEGALLGPGAAGEIVVRGEQVMAGYWEDELATSRTIVDGWLRTGDIGVIGADGRLTVVDRVKDIIITGGENVSSREVEDALSAHPDVAGVAVVGVPDEYWGEAICAVVVRRPGHLPTPEELISHVRQRISPFKRPRHVLFVDELPLTGSGKVAKGAVRAFARDRTR
ncbi:class I adenylate-forming enzyme family protein [Nocardia sp. NPDC059177]|uniref:class I adenylate-forming enzyme family protein n=1 Tax=Nocardia sp. NPDC059177 TaxID=3346759 RepID=UPI0036819C7B